ncbi:uncharacterized protein LOC133564249 [Nerophis ophidion]|uniref:uncharacterized protein LOC133564249 n=1 Tax=Nerophis ophidion TaxID=159077 RepID=UPI002ADF4B7C|nr:uncharacterized protein LOC133564249 [Nerophis ophidion]
MLAVQFQIPDLTEDLINSSHGSADFDLRVLAEFSGQMIARQEMNSSKLCMEQCSDYEDFTDASKLCTYCKGDRFGQYSDIDTILEHNTILDKALRLNRQIEGSAKLCECSKPSVTSEQCVNHSLARNDSSCREHCTQQQPEPTDFPSGSLDLVVGKSDVRCDGFKQDETINCRSDNTEHMALSQQYKPSGMRLKFLESLPDSSTEDDEKYETAGFAPNTLESVDDSDRGAEICKCDDIQNRSITEDDVESYSTDGFQDEDNSKERRTLSEYVNCLHLQKAQMKVYYDEREGHVDTDRTFEWTSQADVPKDHYDLRGYEDSNQEYETSCRTSERNHSDKNFKGFFVEEDSSSDCSSSESKSFKTCPEDFENSLDSSGESEKAQEDSSDEQTQWESFEEDDDIAQGNVRRLMNNENKTSTFDFVVEDYFDFFDMGDDRRPAFTQRHYISCFDGGDIHERLREEQLKEHKHTPKTFNVEEINSRVTNMCFCFSDKACDDMYGCLRRDTKCRFCESEPRGEEQKTKLDDDLYNGNHVNKDITSDAIPCESATLNASEICPTPKDENHACVDGVEEYYVYQIQRIQTSPKQSLNEEKTITRSSRSEDPLVSSRNECVEVQTTCSAREQRQDANGDSASNEIPKEVRADIIHSVVSEDHKIEEGDTWTEDSDEENSDNDYYELCECEYCIPPTKQISTKPLLPQMKSNDTGKICVVIDLDETLVHSSFTPVNNADFITPIDIDGEVHQVYVSKRPHVDEFLKRMGEMFECVLFTASLSKYADPVSDILDRCGAFRSRLFREACVFHKGNYVKDLSHLGRDLNKVIIIDNSPASYVFHPDNAVPVGSWFDDTSDSELLDLIPFFERLSSADDIYDLLKEQKALG